MLKYKLPISFLLLLIYKFAFLGCFYVNASNTNQQEAEGHSSQNVPPNGIPQVRQNLLSKTRGFFQRKRESSVEKTLPALVKVVAPLRNPNLSSGVHFVCLPRFRNKNKVEHSISIGDKGRDLQLYQLPCRLSKTMIESIRAVSKSVSHIAPFDNFAKDFMYRDKPFTLFVSNQGQAFMFVQSTYNSRNNGWKTECQTKENGFDLKFQPTDQPESELAQVKCEFKPLSTVYLFRIECRPFGLKERERVYGTVHRIYKLVNGVATMQYNNYQIYDYDASNPFPAFFPGHDELLASRHREGSPPRSGDHSSNMASSELEETLPSQIKRSASH